MKKLSLLAIFGILSVFMAVNAATPQEEVTSNYNRSGSNHYAYPIPVDIPVPELSAAPAGYEAFYMSHYGRHGSRWLTSSKTYENPVKQLARADSAGVLTLQGQRLLRALRQVKDASWQRAGDLSDVGADQHQAIAVRMVDNFPTIFADGANIDARSTVVIRCILSMQNETMILRTRNPRMNITTDASYHDMYYMGWGYGEDTLANHIRDDMKLITDSIYAAEVQPERFLKSIISDSLFAANEINGQQLMRDVFDIAGSLQGHYQFDYMNLFYLFTNDEIFHLWRLKNIYWYVNWANCPLNGNRMPFIERALLRDMIAKADEAIDSNNTGASLRFGHETCLLPLACLMELDNVNYSTTDLDNLHLYWQDYNIFPKACNIQMVFYRPVSGSGDILVKVLLNEHEATLPITTDGPYARWDELKAYYQAKLDQPTDWSY
ncbi:MAG: histidine-type phosphatase [Muribaculaceae bacterium]|nr:histidine-type phosphatase [Muribaculaceae bacterium]